MRVRLQQLDMTCKKSVETIAFAGFNYFYGEMGAGKSSIARLIDYCLGGSLDLTPAMQSEFVAADLSLTVNEVPLSLFRERESDQVVATWGPESKQEQQVVPARKPSGVVIPGTDVENLTDLLFHLSGVRPPKVRRSQYHEESGLERLSFRDLFWYCYLDQDSMDSSFFNLDTDADQWRRLKSRNVLRFVLGVHQERVADLELQLEELRLERAKYAEAAKVLAQTLEEAGVSTELGLTEHLASLDRELHDLDAKIGEIRTHAEVQRSHVADSLRSKARDLASEIAAIETAISEINEAIVQDTRHLNELLSLSTKFRRIASARAVLDGVAFERCPKCTHVLPARSPGVCPVCGEPEGAPEDAKCEAAIAERDLVTRKGELEEIIAAQNAQLKSLQRRVRSLCDAKVQVDQQLGIAMRQYDSAYLSEALASEQRRSAVSEEIRSTARLRTLPAKVAALRKEADDLAAKEAAVRRELSEARKAAEMDTKNVGTLRKLFLDCLLRSRLAGFTENDVVRIPPRTLLPEVAGESGDLAITSFSTLGSGGKKTLFKCCFALAIHRLAVSIGAFLPTLLIIDSPMKNISERENRSQFEGFHQLLYELSGSELEGTQFLLIDKEYCAPAAGCQIEIRLRHMKVDDAENPPLIRYYRGK